MRRGKNSDSIPTDLIPEICSRLPAKSVARFRCVSKLWGSMLHRSYFKELFLTRSRARPCLLFAFKQEGLGISQCDDEWSFFSSPQLQNPYGKSSPVVSASFHMKFSKEMRPCFRSLASGLICFSSMRISKRKGEGAVPVIFNLRTRQYASLPGVSCDRELYLLGSDPIDKQFKVLSVSEDDFRVLTVGTGETRWRKIQCSFTHVLSYIKKWSEICINGVLYYSACIRTPGYVGVKFAIVCFDVRSEKIKFIDFDLACHLSCVKLVNYKGRLGGIRKEYDGGGKAFHKLVVYVLEDVEKPEWSKHVYTLPKNNGLVEFCNISIVGVTAATGEIVLSKKYTSSEPFYVFYFNPERNTLQSVEIQGFGEYYEALDESSHRVYAFVDHVDDLDINDAKHLKSSEGLDIIKKVQKLPKHLKRWKRRN